MTSPAGPHSADVILYTDGACSGNPGPGGWAYILIHPATRKEKRASGGHPETTNNRMELTGVIEGLKALKADHRWRVRIMSDSEYVVRGVNEWMAGWISKGWRRGKGPRSSPVKNDDLWRELHGLIQKFDTSFQHVRGHAGEHYNEECDRMAVEAIETMRATN